MITKLTNSHWWLFVVAKPGWKHERFNDISQVDVDPVSGWGCIFWVDGRRDVACGNIPYRLHAEVLQSWLQQQWPCVHVGELLVCIKRLHDICVEILMERPIDLTLEFSNLSRKQLNKAWIVNKGHIQYMAYHPPNCIYSVTKNDLLRVSSSLFFIHTIPVTPSSTCSGIKKILLVE